ncbi:MAG: hypothetical protein ACTMH0_11320 [Brevibacterium linens]
MSQPSAARKKVADGGPGPLRLGIAALLFLAVVVGATALSHSLFDDARDTRIAEADSGQPRVDSVYSDRIESQYDSDYDRSRYQEIAHAFEKDPVWVDDYLAFEMRDEDLDDIHEAIEKTRTPIYVAFLAATELDDTDGQAELLANRIIAEVPDDEATVLVIGDNREAVANKGISREIVDRPDTLDDDHLSQVGLTYVRALLSAPIEEENFGYGASFDRSGNAIVVNEKDDEADPRALRYSVGGAVGGAVIGLLIGGGLAVGGISGYGIWRRRQLTLQSEPQTQEQAQDQRK